MRSVFSIGRKKTRLLVRLAGFAILCGLAASQMMAQCTGDPPNVATVTSGSTSQQAADCLQTDGTFTVTGSSNIQFHAGTSVYLREGFTAQAGTSGTAFTASIGPVVTTPNLIEGYIMYPYGAPYNPPYGFQLNAQEGSSSGPFTWTVTGLPGGLSASTGGYISGTVSTTDTATGYAVSATATDALGHVSLPVSFTLPLMYVTAMVITSSPAHPSPGASVTLTAVLTREGTGAASPGTVSSVTWTGGLTTASYSAGVATTAPFTFSSSNSVFTAFYSGYSSTDDFNNNTIRIISGPTQTISFASPSNVPYGTGQFALSAAAYSSGSPTGLPVSFQSTTTSVCAVAGNAVTILSGGLCSITASQAGNGTYGAATPVTQSFTVTPISQTIIFPGPSNQDYGSAPFSLSATASSGLVVAFSSSTMSVCTVSGTTVTLVATGTCTIAANQSGNADFSAAPAVSPSFTVSPATLTAQTITFASLSPVPLSAGSVTLSVTTTSPLTVSLLSNNMSVCTISGSSAVLVAVGICSITASQAGNTIYAPATPVTQTFSVDSSCSGGTSPLREYIRLGGRVVAIENWCD